MKKNKAPKQEVEIQAAPEEVLPDLPEDTSDIALDQAIQDFSDVAGGKDYKIRAEMFDKEDRSWYTLDTLPFDSGFDPLFIMKKYGSGRYRFTFLDDHGRYIRRPEGGGQFQKFFKAPPEPVKQDVQDPLNNPVVTLMIQNMKDQAAQSLKMVELMAGRQTTGPTLLEQIQVLKAIQGFTPESKDPLDMLDKVLRIQGRLTDNKEEAPKTGVAQDLLAAKEILQALGLGKLFNKAPAAPGVEALPAPVEKENQEIPIMDQKTFFKPYVRALLKLASDSADPGDAALHLMEQLDLYIIPALTEENKKKYGAVVTEELVWDKVIEAAGNKEKIEAAFKVFPEMEAQRDWLLKVLEASLKLAAEENEPVEEPGPLTPDATVNGTGDIKEETH